MFFKTVELSLSNFANLYILNEIPKKPNQKEMISTKNTEKISYIYKTNVDTANVNVYNV